MDAPSVGTPWHEDQLVEFSTVNVLTCFAYPAAGIGIAAVRPGDLAIMTALTLLGFASAIYHATRADWAERIDYAGILLTFGLLAGVAFGLSGWWAFGIALVFSIVVWPAWNVRVVIVGVLVALLLWRSWSSGYMLAAFALLGLGWAAWWLDRWRRFPAPRWGHGIWHLFTAAGIAVLYLGVTR